MISENIHAAPIRNCDICMTKGDHVMMDCAYIAKISAAARNIDEFFVAMQMLGAFISKD